MSLGEWSTEIMGRSVEITRWSLDDGGVCVTLECDVREVTLFAPESGAWCYVVREVDGEVVGSKLIDRSLCSLDVAPLLLWVAAADVLCEGGR